MFESLTNSLKYFNSQNYYTNNVKNVYDSYNNDLTKLKKDIYNTKQTKNVNERLGEYYYKNTTIINWWLYYLKSFYYILIACSLFIFIYKKQFRNIKIYLFYLTILLLPYLLDYYYAFIMRTFKHFKLDNVYFIFFVSFISIVFTLNKVSKIPFSE